MGYNKSQSAGDSYISYDLSKAALSTEKTAISLFFKTKSADGLLFYLGEEDTFSSPFLTAYLKAGSLVAALGNSSSSSNAFMSVSALNVSDGVMRKMTVSLDDAKETLELDVDGSKSTVNIGELSPPQKSILYVGGLKRKDGSARKKRSTVDAQPSDLDDVKDFKGRLPLYPYSTFFFHLLFRLFNLYHISILYTISYNVCLYLLTFDIPLLLSRLSRLFSTRHPPGSLLRQQTTSAS